MADFKIGKIRFTWRADWASVYDYVKDDIVRYGAKTYVCMVTHTSSANFYTDLYAVATQWNEMVDGYEWSEDWTASTFYQLNDLVKYSGIVYRCTTSHTSSSTLEINIANWTVHFSGDDWNNVWTATTFFNVNDLVRWGGFVYRCNTAHTSATYAANANPALAFVGLEADQAKWTVVHDGVEWKGVYATAVQDQTFVVTVAANTQSPYQNVYVIDGVQYPNLSFVIGTTYTFNQNLASNNNHPINFSATQAGTHGGGVAFVNNVRYYLNNVLVADPTAYNAGFNAAATRRVEISVTSATPNPLYYYCYNHPVMAVNAVIYISAVRYKKGDIVRYNSSIWYCTTGHVSQPLIDETKFALWLPGLSFENAWNSATYYTAGDVISHGGYVYRAITNNINQTPPISPSDWQIVVESYRDRLEWSNATVYLVGDLVRWSGTTYVAVADNAGEEPPDVQFWTAIVITERFRGIWTAYHITTAPYNYLVGDVVSFGSSAWLCVQRHQAEFNNRPTVDTQGNFWQPFILGQATNVLEFTGDIKSYGITDDGSTVGPTRVSIGGNATVLKANNGTVQWAVFNQSPKVYYVSPLGTDSGINIADPLFGQDENEPFASVRYACQYIQADLAARAPAAIFVKSGVYFEVLPIIVPATVSIIGDELRNPTIRPAPGYVTSDMFHMRNATGLRNMTLEGLTGTLGIANQYLTQRPTAGAYVSLDPGTGPGDASVWITTKSPYIQNVTTFGTGCVGIKVDGSLHNSGNRSIVANDFTQVLSDGIGAWVTNNGRSELVSVFTYYNHIGYLAENNGKIRATNGNNSYGDYGSVAEGVNVNEVAKTALVNNRSSEATVAFVFTNGAQILRYEYANAGSEYTAATSVITGAGVNAAATHDEFRDSAIYQIRVAAPGDSSQPGGGGYVGNSGNAQTGSTTAITLSATDANDSGVYVGMEIVITSGLGVGQVGYVYSYDSGTKIAVIYNQTTGAAGWNHVIPGTAILATLDTTTAYSITPRVALAAPTFTPVAATTPSGAAWVAMVYGNSRFVLIATGSTVTTHSTNGITWISGGALPASTTWTDLAAGAVSGTVYQVAVASGGTQAAYSSNDGTSWTAATLSASAVWTSLAYGNSRFVAVSSGGTASSISTNGTTWTAGGALPSSNTWSAVTYGNGKFVAVAGDASATTAAAYSTNGVSWLAATLPTSANWTSVAYGNGRFVAVAQGGTAAAYSLDGITWTASTLPSSGSWFKIKYGQGTFVAMQGYAGAATNSTASSTDGVVWTVRTLLTTQAWSTVAFGNPTAVPVWAMAVTASTAAQYFFNITQAVARSVITSGRITSIRVIEPGSGYFATPAMVITDPNNTGEVVTEIRRASGALANPSLSNSGTAYVTASATIVGNGYADNYQTGSFLQVKNLTLLPGPGANLQLATIVDTVYTVVNVDNITGTIGNYAARLRIFPQLGVDESPIENEAIEIREDYSQCRISGHDFLEIGTGSFVDTNYPNTNLQLLAQENQVVQNGGGRVFYTSTDQDGNFRVGELFEVEQSTGVVSINADAFELSGLTEIRLGGVTLGGTGATINEFSTDPTFSANTNNIVPTQKAIKAFIASRIGGGGSDLDVNEIQIGSITFDAPNDIGHIANGTIDITAVSEFKRGILGLPLAMAYFME